MDDSQTPNFDELKRLATNLKALLDDPHPGLISWGMALTSDIEAISKFATRSAVIDEAIGLLESFGFKVKLHPEVRTRGDRVLELLIAERDRK